jgi:hypothetical protein
VRTFRLNPPDLDTNRKIFELNIGPALTKGAGNGHEQVCHPRSANESQQTLDQPLQ